MNSKMLKCFFIILLLFSFIGLSEAKISGTKNRKGKIVKNTRKTEKYVIAVLEAEESLSFAPTFDFKNYVLTGGGTSIGKTTDGRATSYSGRHIAVGSDGVIHALWGDAPNHKTFYSQSTDNGETWSPQSEMQGDLITNRRGPAIAVDPNNPLNVFITFCGRVALDKNQALYFRKSTDGGLTWSDPLLVDCSAHSPVGHDLIVDKEGNPHVTFDNGTDEHTYYNCSTDGGTTWLAFPILVDLGHGGLASFGGSLAVDSNGNVHVIFGNDGGAGYWGDKNMYYNYKEKANIYFTEIPPVQLSTGESGLGMGTIVIDSKDQIHVWYDDGTLKYRKKDASGWSEEVEIPRDDPEKGGEMGMVSAAIDANDNLFLVYKDGSGPGSSGSATGSGMDIYCGTNIFGEWKYVNISRYNGTVGLNFPDIAREILDDGVVHLIYTLNPGGGDDDPAASIIYERAYPWPPEPSCGVEQFPDTYDSTGTFKATASTGDIDGTVVSCKLFVMKNGEQFFETEMTELEKDKYETEFTINAVPGDTISYYGRVVDNDGKTGDSHLLKFAVTKPVNPNVDLLFVRDDPRSIPEFWTPLMDCVKTSLGEKYNFEVWDISTHKGIDASVTHFGWKTIFIHGWDIQSVPTRSYEGNTYAAFLNAGTEEAPANLCLVGHDYFFAAGEPGKGDLTFGPGDFAYDFFQIAGGESDPRIDDQVPDSLLLGIADDPISGSFAEEPLELRADISEIDSWIDYTNAVEGANDIFMLFNIASGSGVKYDGGTFKAIHLPWMMPQLVKYKDAGDSTQVPQDGAYTLMENILHWFETEPGEPLPSAVEEQQSTVVADFALEQNYPNPFNPVTYITYSVQKTSKVEIVIYNSLGQKIRTLVNEKVKAGRHSIEWNGVNETGVAVSSGLYFYQLKAENFTKTNKMVLMK